jgi:hypothetical protein
MTKLTFFGALLAVCLFAGVPVHAEIKIQIDNDPSNSSVHYETPETEVMFGKGRGVIWNLLATQHREDQRIVHYSVVVLLAYGGENQGYKSAMTSGETLNLQLVDEKPLDCGGGDNCGRIEVWRVNLTRALLDAGTNAGTMRIVLINAIGNEEVIDIPGPHIRALLDQID